MIHSIRAPINPETNLLFSRSLLDTNIFVFFQLPRADGRSVLWKFAALSPYRSLFQALSTPQPHCLQKVSVRLINCLQPFWSSSKISWRSFRPYCPPTRKAHGQAKKRHIQCTNIQHFIARERGNNWKNSYFNRKGNKILSVLWFPENS